jgi:hypothetical protein
MMSTMKLSVQGGMSTSNDHRTPARFHLRIEDRTSSVLLADVTLTAEEWLRLTNGTMLTVDGDVSPHLERVGRKMVVRQVPVPRDAVPSYNRTQAALEARDWAEPRAEEGETTEVRSTNSGWVAIYRAWPEA